MGLHSGVGVELRLKPADPGTGVVFRRVDLTDKYSDSGYSGYAAYHKGDVWASTVWDIYLALGGDSPYEASRKWAGNLVLKLLLEANVAYALQREDLGDDMRDILQRYAAAAQDGGVLSPAAS